MNILIALAHHQSPFAFASNWAVLYVFQINSLNKIWKLLELIHRKITFFFENYEIKLVDILILIKQNCETINIQKCLY
jgi:hypothetical protein